MILKPKFIALAILFLTSLQIPAIANDSLTPGDTTHVVTTDGSYGEDTGDFSPGLAFFALIGFGFVLVCVGAGIALMLVVLAILFVLVSAGVLSVSVLVGIHQRSFAKGFQTFLVSASVAGSVFFFSAGFWGLNKVMHWWTSATATGIGAALGLLIGLSFGFLAFHLLRRLTTFLRQKLETAQ